MKQTGIEIKLSRVPINIAHLMTSVKVTIKDINTGKEFIKKGWKRHFFELPNGTYRIMVRSAQFDIGKTVSEMVEVKDVIRRAAYRHPISIFWYKWIFRNHGIIHIYP